MKTLGLIAVVLVIFLSSGPTCIGKEVGSFSSLERRESLQLLVSCKRIQLDIDVTASNGCRFHVTGWIEIGWSVGDGFEVEGYDIEASGPCGNFHFTSNLSVPAGEDITITAGQLYEIVVGVIDDKLAN